MEIALKKEMQATKSKDDKVVAAAEKEMEKATAAKNQATEAAEKAKADKTAEAKAAAEGKGHFRWNTSNKFLKSHFFFLSREGRKSSTGSREEACCR